MSLLGVDLGTSGVRVVAFSGAGAEIAAAARVTALRRRSPGLVETDADEVLAAVVDLLGEVAGHPAVIADPPDAMSFSVQGEAVLPVDRNGHALAPAPVSMDERGAEPASRIVKAVGAQAVQRITGQPPNPMFSLYKIAAGGPNWTSPAVHGYRTLGEYVAGRLGARPAIDTSMAARTGAYDVQAGTWSAVLLGAAAVDERLLSEVVPAGTAIGKLSPEAAARSGLPSGLPLAAGAHDQAASFLGGGGRVGISSVVSFGSSDCLTVGTAGRPRDLGGTGLATYPIGDGTWLTLAGTAAGGWVLDWFATLTGVTGPADRDDLFEQAAARPPRVLVLPYFTGSGTVDNDPYARGAIVGLGLDTTRAELARAFLESFGFELRKIVDMLADRDIEPGALHAVGGGARSTRALAIRASAAGRAMTPVPGHAAARGAGLLAGVAIGLYPSLGGLPAPACGPALLPDPATAEWYAAQARRFSSLYPALRPDPL
jgi:xylulokinase